MGAQETKPLTYKVTHMKNFLINSASIFAGKRFARMYRNHSKYSAKQIESALDLYRSLRRMLPVDPRSGNRIGNHLFSEYRPWGATQGYKVRTFSSPSV